MRTPIYLLMAALLVGGCTHYHVTPAGAPSTDRVAEPEPVEPLELDIGRPSGSQLLIQTSRPAYVAIFEIIPNRGVTLIYPAAVHQQNMLVSGLTWVPLWWLPKRVTFNSDRYIYAVASEEPLNLSGETFASGYFSRVLGLPIYRAERPYSTMRAISTAIVPDVAAEEWAEDVLVLTPTWHTEVYRTARIYCAGGRFFDVPEDMVSRVWCPTRTRVVIVDGRPRSREYPVGRPARPDSVFGQGGTRVRLEPRRPRGPIARVVDPNDRDRDHDRGRGRVRDARDDRDDRDKDSEKPEQKGRSRIVDLFKDAKEQAKQREKEDGERQRREAKEERERQRREAEEARRREAEERKDDRDERKDERRDDRDDRKDERREDRDERKDERRDDRDGRKEEHEERKDERKNDREEKREEKREEPKQQGQAREEKREEKQEEKRAEPREEKREEKKGRARISDMIKEAKEKEKPNKP